MTEKVSWLIVMTQTIRESLNGGRTMQDFVKDQMYWVPNSIARRWIEQGWATVARSAARTTKE